MGSAVVKPLSRRRGKIKSNDSGDNNTVQGNQNVNITEGGQDGDVGIGEPTKNVQVDSLADPVSNLCKPARVKKSDQDAEQHQPSTPALCEKSSPCYDSDEEPYPIQLAKSDSPKANDGSEKAATRNSHGKELDTKGGNDKVSFEPHLPLAERSHPPLSSDHYRFRRLSSLIRSGGTLSCPPFRSSRKSAKALGDKEAKKQEGQADASLTDRLQETAGEAETQQVNVDEKDVCCDARSPSPEYDKLEGIEIVNTSPKSVDHPAIRQLLHNTVNIPCAEETHKSRAVGRLDVDDTTKILVSEGDEHPLEKDDDPFLDTEGTSHGICESALDTDYPGPRRSDHAIERDKPNLDAAESHYEQPDKGLISTSSSKENTTEQSFEDPDPCPAKRLDTTHDLYDRDNSKPVSECPSESVCCIDENAHALYVCEMAAGLSRTYGTGEVKGATPSTSQCSAAEPVCEEDYDAELKPTEFNPSYTSPGRHEETYRALLTDFMPNNPAFITHWPEDADGFGCSFNSIQGDPVKECLKNGLSFTKRAFDGSCECEFRNMSPIKEETPGYDSQNERCNCDSPRSRGSSRSNSAKSAGVKDVSGEVNDQCKCEQLFSSSRNSLHKSLSHLRQTTPRPSPVPMCRSNASEQRFECASNAENYGTNLHSHSSSREKLNVRGQASSPRTPSHQITPSVSQSQVYARQSVTSKSPTGQQPTRVRSSTSSVRFENSAELEPPPLRSRPKSEKLYAPMNLFPNAAGKTRPISANVLGPINSQSLQPAGAMKLPPINSSCSMTTRPISAKQPSSKSEVFLSTPRPDLGKRSAPTSRPVSAKQFAPQSRPVSASPRPCSATSRSHPDAVGPALCGKDMRFDRAEHGVRLSPIHLRPDHQGCGEQWSGHSVHEVDVNECLSATDLRISPSSTDCKHPGFAEGGDGPHVVANNSGKIAEGASPSRDALTSTSHSASATSFNASKTNLATSSADRLTERPDMPSWGDGPPQETAGSKEACPLQALTLSVDQIGSIRQQLYEEGLKPAERDGGVAFFIPMTVDGLQPQANGVTISDRLTRSRKSSLSYDERLILANINRQAQLHKRKEFAVKDIQNVKGAATTSEIDRSKQEDELDADLDSSF